MAKAVLEIPLTRVLPDLEQPRKYFDRESLSELAQSIRQHGLLQPVLVRPNGDASNG
jgi:ParB family chromosome partitioning protein